MHFMYCTTIRSVPKFQTWAKYDTRKAENWGLSSVCSCSATQQSMPKKCYRLISLPACTALRIACSDLTGCTYSHGCIIRDEYGNLAKTSIQYTCLWDQCVAMCDCISRGHCYTSCIPTTGFLFLLIFFPLLTFNSLSPFLILTFTPSAVTLPHFSVCFSLTLCSFCLTNTHTTHRRSLLHDLSVLTLLYCTSCLGSFRHLYTYILSSFKIVWSKNSNYLANNTELN